MIWKSTRLSIHKICSRKNQWYISGRRKTAQLLSTEYGVIIFFFILMLRYYRMIKVYGIYQNLIDLMSLITFYSFMYCVRTLVSCNSNCFYFRNIYSTHVFFIYIYKNTLYKNVHDENGKAIKDIYFKTNFAVFLQKNRTEIYHHSLQEPKKKLKYF